MKIKTIKDLGEMISVGEVIEKMKRNKEYTYKPMTEKQRKKWLMNAELIARARR